MQYKRYGKNVLALALGLGMTLGLFSGCGSSETDNASKGGNKTVKVADDTDNAFKDNDDLYQDDDSSVETMYLTVSQGNASENTNHTWNEINTYSVYDYQNMGVKKYQVEGLLQIGTGNGNELDPNGLGYYRTTPNCRVSIRGQSSSRSNVKSYKIKLDDEAGDWNGNTVINLNKHVNDGMRFRNKLMYDLQSEVDAMVSLQTKFVHLYVKDDTGDGGDGLFHDYGLYTYVEQPNKDFLKRHGLDRFGHLYKENQMFEFRKYDEIKLTSDSDYNADDFAYYLETKGDTDHTKLINMLTDVNDATVSPDEVLDKWFDRDNLATWLAFNILTGNTDTQSRNTLIYSPLNSNTWYLMDWDCDGAFLRNEDKVKGEAYSDYGWEKGITNYWGNSLFQKAFKSESFRTLLDKKIDDLYKGVLSPDKVQAKADELAGIVKPYVYGSDKLNARLTEEQYDSVEAGIGAEVTENYELYKKSLEDPEPFYIEKPEISDGNVRFTWDASFDFQKDELLYSFMLANNLNFDNPIATADNLYATEYDYVGTLSPGQYFIKVTVADSDGNTNPAFDYYLDENSVKHYGTVCFYVEADGTVRLDGE